MPRPAPLPEGDGWREVRPPRARWRLRPPLAVRRAVPVAALDAPTWDAAVAAAERAFRRPGLHGEGARWEAVGRPRVRLEGGRDEGGPFVAVAHERAAPRPWVEAAAWLCWPAGIVVAVVLLARPSVWPEWGVVVALAAAPVGVGAVVWGAGWARLAWALWGVRRVLRAVAARPALGVEAPELDEPPDPEPPGLDVFPDAVGVPEWLSADEIEGLLEARPAPVVPLDARRPRRAAPRASVERSAPPLPEGFTEWRPA